MLALGRGGTHTTHQLVQPDPVEEARRGSPEALALLYGRYADDLFRLAWRVSGSAADAEDVLHDLFVGLPELLQRYDERGQLAGWLRRVTVRLTLVHLRRERRRSQVELDVGSPASVDPRAGAAAVDLARALVALPDPLRAVLALKYEGYSHDEIADLLGISAGASRVRHLRALRRLRQLLEPGS